MIFVFHFYTNAFGFATGLVITQFQPSTLIDIFMQSDVSKAFKDVEMSLLYDSFIFDSTQRKYPTYKRELCVIITFCRKYNYLCKHPYQPVIVYIDYKSFTHFLELDLYKKIYDH